MTTEILEKANELNKKITAMKAHLDYVKGAESWYGVGATMYIQTSNPSLSSRNLLSHLLPISIEDFMYVYIVKTESYLEKLQKEFEYLTTT